MPARNASQASLVDPAVADPARVRHQDGDVVPGETDVVVEEKTFPTLLAHTLRTVSTSLALGRMCPPIEPMSALITDSVTFMEASLLRAALTVY